MPSYGGLASARAGSKVANSCFGGTEHLLRGHEVDVPGGKLLLTAFDADTVEFDFAGEVEGLPVELKWRLSRSPNPSGTPAFVGTSTWHHSGHNVWGSRADAGIDEVVPAGLEDVSKAACDEFLARAYRHVDEFAFERPELMAAAQLFESANRHRRMDLSLGARRAELEDMQVKVDKAAGEVADCRVALEAALVEAPALAP